MIRPNVKQLTAFIITWCSYAIVYFLRKPLGVIKPSLENEFHVSKVQLGWLDVALLLPYSLVQISSSSIADRFGPRLTISLCLCTAGTAMFTFGYWDQYWILFLLMLINGAMQGNLFAIFWTPDKY
jgi:sugar phosphate permease